MWCYDGRAPFLNIGSGDAQTGRYDLRFGALTLTATRAIGEREGGPVVRDQDLTALTLSKKGGGGEGKEQFCYVPILPYYCGIVYPLPNHRGRGSHVQLFIS